MDAVKLATEWLDHLGLELSVVTPNKSLTLPEAGIAPLVSVISKDPLLALQIFRLARRDAGSDDVRTLADAVEQVGVDNVLQFSHRLPRIDMQSASHNKLLQSVADSLLSSSLLKYWHRLRQVEWKEADHWACLFSNVPEWFVAYKDPMLLEGIEFRVNAGESADTIFTEIFGFSYQDLFAAISDQYQLPSLLRLGADTGGSQIQLFKYQALNYYLPISNQLATACRKDWGSSGFKNLINRAQTATMIDDFELLLPQWLAEGARDNNFPYCNQAIIKYFNRQPELFVGGYPPIIREVIVDHPETGKISSSLEVNQAADEWASNLVEETNQAVNRKSDWLELSHPAFGVVSENESSISANLSSDAEKVQINSKPETEALVEPRGNSQLIEETVFLFNTQKVRYSNEVIAFEALTDALYEGMGFSRVVIALHQPTVGQIRVQYRKGTEDRLQLHNLTFAVPEFGIISRLVEQSMSFWLKPENASKAWQNLPRRLGEAVNSQDFFIKSIHVNGKFRALVYVDVYNQVQPLAQSEYNHFRSLINLVEKVINHQTPISSSQI